MYLFYKFINKTKKICFNIFALYCATNIIPSSNFTSILMCQTSHLQASNFKHYIFRHQTQSWSIQNHHIQTSKLFCHLYEEYVVAMKQVVDSWSFMHIIYFTYKIRSAMYLYKAEPVPQNISTKTRNSKLPNILI